MTTPPPTPAPPLTSASAVAAQLSMPTDADTLARLEPVVAAVNVLVPRLASTPPAAQAVGATMLAGRLWRRRNSPEGVSTFGAEGAVYVSRNDPDVALLLGIGAYSPPVVG